VKRPVLKTLSDIALPVSPEPSSLKKNDVERKRADTFLQETPPLCLFSYYTNIDILAFFHKYVAYSKY